MSLSTRIKALAALILFGIPLQAYAQSADPVARHRAEYTKLQAARAAGLDSLSLDPSDGWATGTVAQGAATATAYCLDGAVRVTVTQHPMEGGYAVHTTWFTNGRPFFALQESGIVGGRLTATGRWYWRFEGDGLVRALGAGNRPFSISDPDVQYEAEVLRTEALAIANAARACRPR